MNPRLTPTGLFQPELATGALLTWVFGRIFYTVSSMCSDESRRAVVAGASTSF